MEKYLKYVIKNDMIGGLIGRIKPEKLISSKSKYEIPPQIKKYVDMMTVPNTLALRVGSSITKIQPYFSDVDVMNIINLEKNTNEVIDFFITHLKENIQNLITNKGAFFSDFKAGGMHWTIDEIMAGTKNGVSLQYACAIKDVIKLDIIGPYNQRYLEMSCFYILKSTSGYINVENNYFGNFKQSLLKDIQEYKITKPFKAIKRIWSLARMEKNINILDQLQDLIKSNIALLSQINADIETLILLVEKNINYDLQFVINEINGFRERMSHILDIDFDSEKLNLIFDILVMLFMNNSNNKNEIIERLTQAHDHLLEIINKETFEYLNQIKFVFP